MNFKFTWKKAAVFTAGLVAAGAVGAWLNNQMLPLVIMICVVSYLASSK